MVLEKATEYYDHGIFDVALFVCSAGAPSTTSSHWRDVFLFFLFPLPRFLTMLTTPSVNLLDKLSLGRPSLLSCIRPLAPQGRHLVHVSST